MFDEKDAGDEGRKPHRTTRLLERLGTPYLREDGLSMTYVPGDARPEELVVAVCSANISLGGAPEENILGIRRSRGRRAALVVADTEFTAFTRPRIVERLTREVEDAVARLGGPRVVTLGSSIGGHGAMHLARRLNAKAALGFSPIYSTDVRIHKEERWAEAQRLLDPEGMATLGDDMAPDCRYVAIFAGDRHVEQRHYAALSRVDGVEVHLLAKGGHRVARELDRAGILPKVVDAAFAGRPMPRAMRRMLASEETVARALDSIAEEIAPDGDPWGRFDPSSPPLIYRPGDERAPKQKGEARGRARRRMARDRGAAPQAPGA